MLFPVTILRRDDNDLKNLTHIKVKVIEVRGPTPRTSDFLNPDIFSQNEGEAEECCRAPG